MTPFRTLKVLPTPSLTVFVALQVLDILTTMLGIHMGASESSFFIRRLMVAGPVGALLISKLFAVVLVLIALKMRRPRVVVFLNFWLIAVVGWNLLMIVITGFRN